MTITEKAKWLLAGTARLRFFKGAVYEAFLRRQNEKGPAAEATGPV